MKRKLLSLVVGGLLSVSGNGSHSSSFNYKYQIKANSLNPIDSSTAYYYKEKMIDKYEDFFFTLSEQSQIDYVNYNINFFKLYDNVKISNQFGTIVITIGKGKGISIDGRFRKNECDNQVINEKYYILEILK